MSDKGKLKANAVKTLQLFQEKNLVPSQGRKAKFSGIAGESGPPPGAHPPRAMTLIGWRDPTNYVITIKRCFTSKHKVFQKFLKILFAYNRRIFTRRGQSQAKDQVDVAAKKVEDRAGARELQQDATILDEEAKPAESSGQDSLVKLQKQLSEKEAELSKLLSDKEKLEAKTRKTLQKLEEKYLVALQEYKATLKENHDKIERVKKRLEARASQKAAAAKVERILTLETTLERKDQELALKEKDILAIVSTLKSKDKKIANLETLKKKHDRIERVKKRLEARANKKAAAAKDERILTLETILERKDQELALKEKDILAILSTLKSNDEKIANLEAALKNSKPIDVVDLISDGNLDYTNESPGPPSKRPRMEHEEVHPKSFLQSIVRVKEERQVAETALADVRDDLDIEKDTITQQEIFLTSWMKKFDDLADIAQNAGVDGAVMKSIRDRSVS